MKSHLQQTYDDTQTKIASLEKKKSQITSQLDDLKQSAEKLKPLLEIEKPTVAPAAEPEPVQTSAAVTETAAAHPTPVPASESAASHDSHSQE